MLMLLGVCFIIELGFPSTELFYWKKRTRALRQWEGRGVCRVHESPNTYPNEFLGVAILPKFMLQLAKNDDNNHD